MTVRATVSDPAFDDIDTPGRRFVAPMISNDP